MGEVVKFPAHKARKPADLPTPRYIRALRCVEQSLADTGKWPSVERMQKATGVRSIAGIRRVANRLVESGRVPHW